MLPYNYIIKIESESERSSDVGTSVLADNLREIVGVVSVDRFKKNDSTMDLGAIISVLATSGATVALAQGIADWLRSRRSTTLVIERDGATKSIKATVSQIDPEAAKRIIELILDA